IVSISNCSASDSITVNYIAISKPDFGTNDTLICPGTSITLDAGNPGASYTWKTPSGTQTTEQITADTAFTYKIHVKKAKCTEKPFIKVKLTKIKDRLGKNTILGTGSKIPRDE